MLLALEYLHAMGFIYRDLKPENILLHHSGHIRLTDFDLVKSATNSVSINAVSSMMKNDDSSSSKNASEEPNIVTNSFVGTLEYIAPEVIVGNGYGPSVDWWTFGILMYEMLFGSSPFRGKSDQDTISRIKKSTFKFPDHPNGYDISKDCKSIIKKLLCGDPKKRIGYVHGAAEIKSHPFFKDCTNLEDIIRSDPPLANTSNDLTHFRSREIDVEYDADNVDIEDDETLLLKDNPFAQFESFDRRAHRHNRTSSSKLNIMSFKHRKKHSKVHSNMSASSSHSGIGNDD